MKEIIQYFETHCRRLDHQQQCDDMCSAAAPPIITTESFISCIRFNGVPILPPVMTNRRRDEAQRDRHSATFKEKCRTVHRPHNTVVVNHVIRKSEATSRIGVHLSLSLERPSVLKPVVTGAWDSMLTNKSTTMSTCSHQESLCTDNIFGTSNSAITNDQFRDDSDLATFDSACLDFASLEESLPNVYNGVPLTSVTERKISRNLTKLSSFLKSDDLHTATSDEEGESGKCLLPNCQVVCDTMNSVMSPWSVSPFNRCSESIDSISGKSVSITAINLSVPSLVRQVDKPVTLDKAHQDCHCSSSDTPVSICVDGTGIMEWYDCDHGSQECSKSNAVHFNSVISECIDNGSNFHSDNMDACKEQLSVNQHFIGDQGCAISPTLTIDSNAETEMKSGVPELCSSLHYSEEAVLCDLSVGSCKDNCLLSPGDENDSEQHDRVVTDATDVTIFRRTCNTLVGLSHSSSLDMPPGFAAFTGAPVFSYCIPLEDACVGADELSNSNDTALVLSSDMLNSSTSVEGWLNISHSQQLTLDNGSISTKPQVDQQFDVTRFVNLDAVDSRPSSRGTVKSAECGGHRRRSSYTILEPSPALVHAHSLSLRGAGDDADNCDHVAELFTEDGLESLSANVKLNVTSVNGLGPLNAAAANLDVASESAGKVEHIIKYLSQVQKPYAKDESTLSLVSGVSKTGANIFTESKKSAQLHGQRKLCNGSQSMFQELRLRQQQLLDQHQKELEEMFVQQRREQMLLQQAIEDHQKRKYQRGFLYSNMPKVTNGGVGQPGSKHCPAAGSLQLFHGASGSPVAVAKRMDCNKHCGIELSENVPQIAPSMSPNQIIKKPIVHPPLKLRIRPGHPEQADEPFMKVKFEKLTAIAKGFLCRSLMRCDKVQELVKTIKDTREFAVSFQRESRTWKCGYSDPDRMLLERIVAQLQAALLDIHEIFFDLPVPAKMFLIEQTRLRRLEKGLKSLSQSGEKSVSGAGHLISSATMKAVERRRRAREVETATRISASPDRQHIGFPSGHSQSLVDFRGPLKKNNQSFLSKLSKSAAVHAVSHDRNGPHARHVRPGKAGLPYSLPSSAMVRFASIRTKIPAASSSVTPSVNCSTEASHIRPGIRLKQAPHLNHSSTCNSTARNVKLSIKPSKPWC